MDPSAAARTLPIAEILGGFITVIGLGLVAYGVSVAQAYVYMLNCEGDPMWMKLLVTTVVLLETGHTAILFRELWNYTIDAIVNPFVIGRIDWSIGVTLFLSSAIATLVEAFYIRRLWILGKHWLLPTFTAVLLIGRFGIHMAVSVETFLFPTWDDFHQKQELAALVKTILSLEAAIDAIIALSMVWFLRRRSNTYTGTKGILTWMMVYIVHSGLILMAVSITMIITFETMADSLTFAGFIAVIGKLYANSLLGTLNTRQIFRSKKAEIVITPETTGTELSSFRRGGLQSQSGTLTGNHTPMQVRVDITRDTSSISDKHVLHDSKEEV